MKFTTPAALLLGFCMTMTYIQGSDSAFDWSLPLDFLSAVISGWRNGDKCGAVRNFYVDRPITKDSTGCIIYYLCKCNKNVQAFSDAYALANNNTASLWNTAQEIAFGVPLDTVEHVDAVICERDFLKLLWKGIPQFAKYIKELENQYGVDVTDQKSIDALEINKWQAHGLGLKKMDTPVL